MIYGLIDTGKFFATNKEKCHRLISKIVKVDKLVVSYDRYHSVYVSKENIINVVNYCKINKILIQGNVIIETPLDMKYADFFNNISVNSGVGKVRRAGRADSIDSLMYKDIRQDNKRMNSCCCDENKALSFFPERGFSYYPNENSKKFSFQTYQNLINSLFYKKIYKIKFKDMLKTIDNNKVFYNPCEICKEYCKDLNHGQYC